MNPTDFDFHPSRNPTWWKRRTSMERCLTLSTAITILIGISLVIALATVLYNRNEEISGEYAVLNIMSRLVTVHSSDYYIKIML